MIIHQPRRRRVAAHLARTGCILSVGAFCLSLASVVVPVPGVASAATAGGAEVVIPAVDGQGNANPEAGQPLTAGDSATPFSFRLPDGAACTGDSAIQGYRIHSYLIGGDIDPNTITFQGIAGPLPEQQGAPVATFRSSLFDVSGSPYAAAQTSNADVEGGPGVIVNLPPLSFEPLFSTEFLPPGDYNAGIACWGPNTAENQPLLDRFWNAKFTLVADAADTGPVGITWTAQADDTASTEIDLVADPDVEAIEGDPVELTATVTPDDVDGTVTFSDGDDPIGDPVDVSGGVGVLETSDLEVGDHVLTADFTPESDSGFGPSTSTALAYVIVASGAADTTVGLSVSPESPAAEGADVTLTATLDPSDAGGSVSFLDGAEVLDDVEIVDGTATYSTSTLAAGTHTLSAEFTPDDAELFRSSTSDIVSYVVGDVASEVTTTTDPGSTTTTVPVETVSGGGSGGGVAFGPSTGASSFASLPRTGGSLSIGVWGFLSLVFGRMAMLLARSPTSLVVATS